MFCKPSKFFIKILHGEKKDMINCIEEGNKETRNSFRQLKVRQYRI